MYMHVDQYNNWFWNNNNNIFWKDSSISFEFKCLVLNKQLWYEAKSVGLTTKGSILMNYVCYLHFLPADNWQVSWHLLLTSCNYMPYIKHRLVCNGPPHTHIHTKWFYVLFKAYSILKLSVPLTVLQAALSLSPCQQC